MTNEEQVFAALANAHPVEMHDTYSDEFWAYFHERHPSLTREEMREMLLRIENEEDVNAEQYAGAGG